MAIPDSPDLVELDPTKKHVVEIQEVSPGPLTYKNFSLPLLEIAASSSSGSTSMTWGHDFYMLSIEYFAGSGSGAVLGDKITAAVDENRNLTDFLSTAGEIQEDETTSDDEVLVNPLAIGTGLLQPGYVVSFGGAANPKYTIYSIDTDTNKIKLDRNLENARYAGDDIFRTIYMGKDIWVLPNSVPIVYGETKIGASKIPAGWALKIIYEAVDSDGRDIYINAEGGIYEA